MEPSTQSQLTFDFEAESESDPITEAIPVLRHVNAEGVPDPDDESRALTVPDMQYPEKPSIDERVALWLKAIYNGFSQSEKTQELYTAY